MSHGGPPVLRGFLYPLVFRSLTLSGVADSALTYLIFRFRFLNLIRITPESSVCERPWRLQTVLLAEWERQDLGPPSIH
jgi:hypothetical protein